MYRSLRIQNLRGIGDLELEDLGLINLVTGLNDSGKSTILEALFLHSSGPLAGVNAIRTLRPGRRQHDLAVTSSIQDPWEDLFRNRNMSEPIRLTSHEAGGKVYSVVIEQSVDLEGQLDLQRASGSGSGIRLQRAVKVTTAGRGRQPEPEQAYVQTLSATAPGGMGPSSLALSLPVVDFKITPQPNGPHLNAFIVGPTIPSDLAEGYSQLRLRGGSFDILGALKEIDSRIKSLEVITESGRSTLWANVGGELFPTNLLGDGAVALLSYVINAAQARDGILLIDELGAGIHHSALPGMWRTLYRAAKRFRVQIFATTHSDEVIEAAAGVVTDRADDLVLYRTTRPEEDGRQDISRYPGRLVNAALNIDTELR